MEYKFGDWVVYNPGYKTEIGRVTEDIGNSVRVCYHTGCTAATTPKMYIRFATKEEIAQAPKGIGYHRFDKYCPQYDEDYCFMCKARKDKTWLAGN